MKFELKKEIKYYNIVYLLKVVNLFFFKDFIEVIKLFFFIVRDGKMIEEI